jgi:hypothetical protein
VSNNKIFIKVEGEIGRNKTISVDYLINLANHLQDLMIDIAKYDLPSDESIDLSLFKLELTDFKKGSAIPVFSFSKESQTTLHAPVSELRTACVVRFNELMIVSGKGNYLELKKKYPEPDKRTKMTESLYGFIQSMGTSPVTVKVDRRRAHKVKPFKKDVHDRLVNEVAPVERIKEPAASYVQLARVKVIEGKATPKVLELFPTKYSHVEYSPETIVHKDRVYELKYPLLCTMDNEEGQIIIENKQLGIYAYGQTPDEVEEMFSEEFDYLFNRYNELEDESLTEDVQFIKLFLNHIVTK